MGSNNSKRSAGNNRYASVADYCQRTGARKLRLAKELGFSRFRFYGLLSPDLYPVALTEEEIGRVAALLNQSEAYVRRLYRRVA